MEVGNAMGDREKLVQTYSSFPEDKGFLYKCLGVILRKSSHKEFVKKHLDTMFATVKHTSQVEREVSNNTHFVLQLCMIVLFAGLCHRYRVLCCLSSGHCCSQVGAGCTR
jgi:hypothetical protein